MQHALHPVHAAAVLTSSAHPTSSFAPLQVRTARVPAPTFRVASSHFLDSAILHDWLKEYQEVILADAGG
jgi:hypothetical protein